MRRSIIAGLVVSVGVVVGAGTAAGQVTTIPDTTVPDTTIPPPPTTDTTPPTTDTTPPTTDTTPPTTVASPPTTTEPIVLPGEWVNTGTVYVGTKFVDLEAQTYDKVNPDCNVQDDLNGTQQFNVVRDPSGLIQAAYGHGTFVNGDEIGMVMIQLSPLPMAIGVYRSFGTCNQDGMAVGSFSATDTTAVLVGSGTGGLPPYSLSRETYIRIDVTSSQAPAQLDLQSAQDYLTKPRA